MCVRERGRERERCGVVVVCVHFYKYFGEKGAAVTDKCIGNKIN